MKPLTDAEQKVFEAVVAGRRNKQIAHDLGVTERTIKAHRQAIMRKTGSTSLAALIRMAVEAEGGKQMDWKFSEGQRVVKTSGYPFPGIVEVGFTITNAEKNPDRYVVNFVDQNGFGVPTGLLHIFHPSQLAHDERFDLQGVLIKPVRSGRLTDDEAAELRADLKTRSPDFGGAE